MKCLLWFWNLLPFPLSCVSFGSRYLVYIPVMVVWYISVRHIWFWKIRYIAIVRRIDWYAVSAFGFSDIVNFLVPLIENPNSCNGVIPAPIETLRNFGHMEVVRILQAYDFAWILTKFINQFHSMTFYIVHDLVYWYKLLIIDILL